MKLTLHEIEFYSEDPDHSRDFYREKLKLPFNFENGHLKVFSFPNGIDIDVSQHHENQVRVSFLTDDLDQYVDHLKKGNVTFEGPYDTHLGLREVLIIDPNNNRFAVHEPSENSPPFLNNMLAD